MHARHREWVIGALGLLLPGLLTGDSGAQHGSWLDKYRGADQRLCCGLTDCRVAPVRLIEHRDTDTTVEVAGVRLTLPAASVHASEEVDTWVCLRRVELGVQPGNIHCAFYSIGG